MFGNKFHDNANVARSYVAAQQLKGWFMANAQRIAVLLSGSMMVAGVVLMYSGVTPPFNKESLLAILAALPFGVIAAFVAVLIEGMIIIASNGLHAVSLKIEQETNVLNKIKKGFTEEERQQKLKKIERQRWGPLAILFIFSFFSLAGAEIFWHSLTLHTGLFFQCVGYIVGAATSMSLTYIELNTDVIARGIEKTISSSALIYTAMEMDAKGQILNAMSDERSRQLDSPEFSQTIVEASAQSLYGVLGESVSNMGLSVSGEQLRKMVTAKKEERDAAEIMLANNGVLPENMVKLATVGRKEYKTKEARAVRDIVRQYSRETVLSDPEQYAREAGVSVNTLRKYAQA